MRFSFAFFNYNCAMSLQVVLKALPPGFLEDLPLEDRNAISKVVGKPITLNGYEEDGRAELEFADSEGVIHFIYVDPKFVVKVDQ